VARIDSPGNAVHYYVSDALHSTSMVVSAAGVVENESEYYPWGGELQFLNNDPGNHYKFSGKERDSESGLDYFGARYYSNGLGRFITPDWAAKAAAVPYAEFSDPQSLNLYGYVRNIPTVKIDVDGHCCSFSDVMDFVAGAVNAYSSDMSFGAGRLDGSSSASKLGAAVGDAAATVQGTSELLAGVGGEAAGLVLNATGAGALIGIPANVVSAGAIVHGGSTALNGIVHLAKNATSSSGANRKGGMKLGSAGGPGAGKRATPEQREAALKENGGKCVVSGCNNPAEHADHAIARSKNGDTTSENLQGMSAHHNCQKGAKSSAEYEQWRKDNPEKK
jgi:RHS repeat-associated protein